MKANTKNYMACKKAKKGKVVLVLI